MSAYHRYARMCHPDKNSEVKDGIATEVMMRNVPWLGSPHDDRHLTIDTSAITTQQHQHHRVAIASSSSQRHHHTITIPSPHHHHCTITAPSPHHHCPQADPEQWLRLEHSKFILADDGTIIAPSRHHHGTITAPPQLHHDCTTRAPPVHHDCTMTALSLHHHGTIAAPSLHCARSSCCVRCGGGERLPSPHHHGTITAPSRHHHGTITAPSPHQGLKLLDSVEVH